MYFERDQAEAHGRGRCDLNDGSSLKGNFFHNPQERIIDMLNDDRHFLPFADNDGVITVVAKAAITSICPAQQKSETTVEPPRRIGI